MNKPCVKCGVTDRNNSGQCRPCKSATSAKWYLKNAEKQKNYSRKYRVEFPNKRKKSIQNWRAANKHNPKYALPVILRIRLCKAIENNQKAGSAVRDLGCTIEELKSHLESLWLPEMTWDNWSRTGWHIDHTIPLAKFDLTDREQFLKACHYTNLQPLWATNNLSKGAK